jgi:hypothetical protein
MDRKIALNTTCSKPTIGPTAVGPTLGKPEIHGLVASKNLEKLEVQHE